MSKEKEKQLRGRKVVIPPENFEDYEWDDDFKLMMFCLEFTRNEMSGEPSKYARELSKEWGYRNPAEIYDLLWYGFKYYKGSAFDEKFKIVESRVDCPICHHSIRFAEVKAMSINDLISPQEGKEIICPKKKTSKKK